jgi:hypothetical protein
LVEEEKRRRSASDAERRNRRRRSKAREDADMARPSEGKKLPDATRIIDALQELADPCPPEALFAALKLDPIAVDSFYAVLRQLTYDGRVAISRPNASDVLISRVKQ